MGVGLTARVASGLQVLSLDEHPKLGVVAPLAENIFINKSKYGGLIIKEA